MSNRPTLGLSLDPAPVESFVRALQEAIDTGSADRFNAHFAADVLWGSPFGAIVEGYDSIHAIHTEMFGAAPASPGASRYSIEHVRFPSEDVAVAYVRRVRADATTGNEAPGKADGFDELALFVLVRRDGSWWLAAGQHVPDRRDVYTKKD